MHKKKKNKIDVRSASDFKVGIYNLLTHFGLATLNQIQITLIGELQFVKRSRTTETNDFYSVYNKTNCFRI
jgi:hypothetical protein